MTVIDNSIPISSYNNPIIIDPERVDEMLKNATEAAGSVPTNDFEVLDAVDYGDIVKHRTNIGTIFSNLKGECDVLIANKIQEKTAQGEDVEAWHHFKCNKSGYVFFFDGKYYEYVLRMNALKSVYKATSPLDLMLGVNRLEEK